MPANRGSRSARDESQALTHTRGMQVRAAINIFPVLGDAENCLAHCRAGTRSGFEDKMPAYRPLHPRHRVRSDWDGWSEDRWRNFNKFFSTLSPAWERAAEHSRSRVSNCVGFSDFEGREICARVYALVAWR